MPAERHRQLSLSQHLKNYACDDRSRFTARIVHMTSERELSASWNNDIARWEASDSPHDAKAISRGSPSTKPSTPKASQGVTGSTWVHKG